MKAGDLVKDNQNGMLGIVMTLDDPFLDSMPRQPYRGMPPNLWIGFKYLEHMDGLTFWQPENNMSVVSSA
jgi:hypothetical protein